MLADELIAVHENARTVAPFTDRQPGPTPDEAYSAAQALHRSRLQRGWKPVGRKIGFTNRSIWPRYGVFEPIWGTVYDATASNAVEGCARVSLDDLAHPRIEPEICFKLRAAPRDASEQSLLDAIEWIAHSVEIVQCAAADWKVTLADCKAQNALHGRLVVGTPIAMKREMAARLPALSLVLVKNGVEVERGVGANV